MEEKQLTQGGYFNSTHEESELRGQVYANQFITGQDLELTHAFLVVGLNLVPLKFLIW